MKKILTLSLALTASATMFAQTQLWNGEEYSTGTDGGFWDRCSREVVENPSKDGINTSDKCLKFTITGNEWNNGSAAKGITCEAFASKRLSLMIKKEENSNVRVEIKCNDVTKKVVAWYDGNGEWRKLYFDFSTNNTEGAPTEITIYPTTDAVSGEQTVYIDNIQIEDAPMVGETLLTGITDGSLTGHIQLTGAWLKGECQNVDGDWQKVEYDDFSTLATKLTDGITSIDMRGTATKDVDVNGMRGNRPNVLIFADETYSADNVVSKQKDDDSQEEKNICNTLSLSCNAAFATPEDFTAKSVSVARPLYAGNNTMCLPFWVSADDLKAKTLAVYSNTEERDNQTVVNFAKKESVDANVPFIALFDEDASSPLSFSNKGVVNTPQEMGSPFTGTYTPGNATGKYGLNNNGIFQKGGDNATITAFSAYLTLPETQEAKSVLFALDGTPTGISAPSAANAHNGVKVYNLQGCLTAAAESVEDLHLKKGIYIINNQKIVIK